MTLPTVVGPLYYWVVRPIWDTVDLVVVSPVVDVACLPYDYRIKHWQRRVFVFVDPEGKPVSGIEAEVVETGAKFRSDDQGRIEFDAKDDVMLRVDATRCYCDWTHGIRSTVQREYVSGQLMPVACERTIQVVPKDHVARRRIHAVSMFMPGLDADYGFDCITGDWVSPFGHGKETNLVFHASGNSESQLCVEVRLPDDKLSGFAESGTGQHGDPTLRTWKHHTNLFRTMRLEKWWKWRSIAFRSHGRNSDTEQDVYGMIDGARIGWQDSSGVCEVELRLSVNSLRGDDGFEWEDHLVKNNAPLERKFFENETCANGLLVRGFYGRRLWVHPNGHADTRAPWFSTSLHKAPCDKHWPDGSSLDGQPLLDDKWIEAIDATPKEFAEALTKIQDRPYLVQEWMQKLSRSNPNFKSENLRLLWNRLNSSTNAIDRACKARVLERPEMPKEILRAEFENACKAGDWRNARSLMRNKGAFTSEEREALYHDPQYALFRYHMAITAYSGWFKSKKALKSEGAILLKDIDVDSNEKSWRNQLHEVLEKRLPANVPVNWP